MWKKKVSLFLFAALSALGIAAGAANCSISSPDGSIQATVAVGDQILWSVSRDGKAVLNPSQIAMDTSLGKLGIQPGRPTEAHKEVREILTPVVAEKRSKIANHYNLLVLAFGQFDLEFRVFNDGAAYRFVTRFDKPVIIHNEILEFRFPQNCSVYFPQEDSMVSHQERLYLFEPLREVKSSQFCSIPALVDLQDEGLKAAITESDLFDYPGFYLYGTGTSALTAQFPCYVLEETMKSDRDPVIGKRADYIAKTDGSRTFPWRVLAIAKRDVDLLNNQLVWQLARPCQIEDTSWIQPGKVAWDWYNANNIYGVDFKAGVNTDTYKYYIDFASRYGLEYIILDEGWYQLGNLLDVAPEMDMEEIFRYAKQKQVGVILWVVWKTLDNQMQEALDQFAKWGCRGIKVDFMQRDDQWMVNFYERVAREAAKRKMLVDFHGSFKPTGLRRTYPNVISREGVKGSENNKWSADITPAHNVSLPYIRMLAGPMDYTPGAMANAQNENFRFIFNRPMSLGTRCHQLAMYVVFESPLQMLCDSPSDYYREPECMEFLAPVPTVWDQTIPLDGKVSQYILVARQKGSDWYVGAMTNQEARTLTLDLSFLTEAAYSVQIWQDGPNADRHAVDYKMTKQTVKPSDKLTIKMAPGGGWAARFVKN